MSETTIQILPINSNDMPCLNVDIVMINYKGLPTSS